MIMKTTAIGLVVVLSSLVLLPMSSAHWWKRLSSAQIAYEGQTLPEADVYRSPTGEILLTLPDTTDERSLYVIYPAENKIGLTNDRHFWFLPGYVFSRYVHPLVLFVDDPVKSGHDPKLLVSENAIEFRTLPGRRVQITFE